LGRHVGGGATLVGSLMNQRLIDELRVVVYPIVLGGRKALFKDVKERHALKFVRTKPSESGFVRLHYSGFVRSFRRKEVAGDPRPDFSGDFHPASREIKQERKST
jgi:dihydrofolate reductase